MKTQLVVIIIALVGTLGRLQASVWRADVDLNYQVSLMNKKVEGTSVLERRVREERVVPKVTLGWLMFPKFYLETDFEYYASPLNSSGDSSSTGWSQSSRVGLVTPSRPLNLTIMVEHYQMQLESTGADYGFGSVQGANVIPYIDYDLPGGSRIFFKYPVYKIMGNKEEIRAGLHLRLTGGPMPYPVNRYQKGWTLKFEYADMTIKKRDEANADYKSRSWFAGIGYTF
jgi:hypothetical protein